MQTQTKQLDLELKYFEPFNADGVKVECLEGDFLGGICTYHGAQNLSFYLEHGGFNYTIQGSKFIMVNNQKFYLNAGDLIYVPKNSIVFSDIYNSETPFKSFNIELLQEKIHSYEPIRKYGSLDLATKPFVLYKDLQIQAIFHSFLSNTIDHSREAEYYKLLKDLIKTLAPLLFNHNSKPEIISEEMTFISKMIVNTIYDNLTSKQMALQCHMSLATFKRKFKIAFGVSPQKWMRNVRLQAAYFHLKTNKMNVAEVARLTGFDNLSHFSYAFKKHFCKSPSTLLCHHR